MRVLLLTLLLSLSSCISSQDRFIDNVHTIAQEVIEDMGFEAPYPRIELVTRSHWSMNRQVQGVASLDDRGREFIYLRQSMNLGNRAYTYGLLVHEFSHLQTWRNHGINTPSHGAQFMAYCTQLTSRDRCEPH